MKVHFAILFILLLANILPSKEKVRERYILPFSFLVLFVYWAIRYEYGQDYWAYYDYFYSQRESENGFGEILFFKVFFPLFKYYYQAVIAQSIYVVFTLYYMVRKYVPSNYYWLFFLLFMCVPGFHFSLISAMRSSMAAATLFWAYDLFYINKKNLVLYEIMVFVATQLHTSAIVFMFVPLVDWLFNRLRGEYVFILLLISLFAAMSIGDDLFKWATNNNFMLGIYDHLSEGFGDSNLLGTVFKGIILIPAFFICKDYNNVRDKSSRRIYVLAFLCLEIRLLNLDFNGRFTAYLFLFVIIALVYTMQNMSMNSKVLMLAPYFLSVIYSLYSFYSALISNAIEYSNGNFYIYKTIFDASHLP